LDHLTSSLIGFAIVIVALTIHEAAHAWTADQLGDPTARMLGRVSLNPLVHIDPIGTVLLPLVAMVSGLPILGWAKPVPVNISRLRHHRRDFMIVAAAGPISNFLQALVIAGVYRLFYDPSAVDLLPAVLKLGVQTNLLLAFFNLIPIPPLDGGNVLAGLVPESAARVIDQLRQFGFIALYALMLSGLLFNLVMPPTVFFYRLLLL
jgi:Zn-dependent protease